MNPIDNSHLETFEESSPCVIREGVFGSTFKKNNESLFLRMELVTAGNTKSWYQFKEMTCWIANQNARGVLSVLVRLAGKSNYPDYEKIKKATGFTNEEYISFTEKAIKLKNKTNNKIVELLEANSTGSNHMHTGFQTGQQYIVYVSKNRNFSIQDADMTGKEINLKNFIESYNDILICVGTDFSEKDSFYTRGIFRNPYWVFEEKYSGLSMLLHGFTGAVANKYFPEKKFMRVKPVGSMQSIIKKSLLPGEGYIEHKDEKIDITALEVSPEDLEYQMNNIKISALACIYNKAMS